VAPDSPSTTLLAAFGGGLISLPLAVRLPLVPGYLSLMSGVQAPEGDISGDDRRRLLRSTLLFVPGSPSCFVALGAGASAIGQTLLEHRLVYRRVAGVAIVAMGALPRRGCGRRDR